MTHAQGSRGMIPLAAILLLAACGPKELRPDAGLVENGVYKNFYFDIVLPVPKGWYAKSPPHTGSHFVQYYIEAVTAVADSKVEKRVFPMMRMASTPAKALRSDDVAITAVAAYVKDKRIVTAHAVKIARVFLEGSPIPVKILNDFHSEKLGEKSNGGVTFVAVDLEWTKKEEGVVLETIYLVLRQDHALVFAVEAKTPEALERGKNALKSMRWGGAVPAESK